jgi:putative ABC transport system substrate-binding protein
MIVTRAPSSPRPVHLAALVALLVLFALALTVSGLSAQTAPLAFRVAILGADPTQVWDAFERRLRDLGYAEGRNLVLERRWSQGYADRVPGLLADLMKVKPAVLVTDTFLRTDRIEPAQCVPLLAIGVSEPYGTCPVFPVARRSLTASAKEVSATHLQLALAAVPTARRLLVLTNSKLAFLVDYVRELEAAAQLGGVGVEVFDVSTGSSMAEVTGTITRRAPDVLILGPAFDQPEVRRQIVGYATRGRIPAVGSHVVDGVVVAANYDWVDLGRRAAGFVDQLLKGAKPADLPATAPTRFEVIVDRRAAKDVGLTLPASLLSRADQVLE